MSKCNILNVIHTFYTTIILLDNISKRLKHSAIDINVKRVIRITLK